MTYRFYFFVGNFPKFFNFLGSITKSYRVEFKIHRKRTFYSLQKKNVPETFLFDTWMQKIKIGHRAKFQDKHIFFPLVLFRFAWSSISLAMYRKSFRRYCTFHVFMTPASRGWVREVVFFGWNSILIFENIPFIEEGWLGALSCR